MLESIFFEKCLVGNFFVIDQFMNCGSRRLTSVQNFPLRWGFFAIVGNFDCHIQIPQGLLC